MTGKNIWWFEELTGSIFGLVGKKIANLGEMLKAGITISPGFGISVETNNEYFRQAKIDNDIKSLSDKIDKSDNSSVLAVSKNIMDLIENSEVPAEIASQILQAYAQLCDKCNSANLPVAVRSSGTVSMPGQMETYLNIRGNYDLLKYVRKCWASAYNNEAILYRLNKGKDIIFPNGVGVQKMVNSLASGVMFTLNPVNGDRSKIYIEASWGLGEAVVSGVATPDTFVVDKVTLEVINQITGSKQVKYVYRENGSDIDLEPVKEVERNKLCLDAHQVTELCRLGKTIEEYYNRPYDIEFGIDIDLPFPENIFILQVRPESVWSKKPPVKVLEYTGNESDLLISMWKNVGN